MRQAVVCAPYRTPVGRFGGALREVAAVDLAAAVLRGILRRTGLEPGRVDDVVLGQAYPSGEAPAIGRVAALDAGLPVTVPGVQLDRRCGSGLQAVLDGAMRVQTGVAEVVLAGGTESMSRVEHYAPALRWSTGGDVTLVDRLSRGRVTAGGRHHRVPGGMLETAENLRREYRIDREAQDRLALASHERAVEARGSGRFDRELVPVEVPDGEGIREVGADEHPRPDTSLEVLAALPAVRRDQDPGATVTAGNAAGQNDGAAACVVTTPETADDLGLRPRARIVSWAVAGVEPHRMGIGPVPASAAALERASLTLGDMDVIELNEAFAVQVLAVLSEWGMAPDDPRLNPNGSGISLGHPVGATGARILTTLLYELERREARHGLETMCVGGGQGIAAVFERIP